MKARELSLLLAVTGSLGLFDGCTGAENMHSGGLLSPVPESDVVLAGADVLIDGGSVQDATISPGQGSSTLFTVTLADPADRSRIARMQMDYPEHSSMMMMGTRSSVDCYDDGTHGDAVPGDGTYSYMDTDGHIGPHREDCATGEYIYTFHGTDLTGKHTNSLERRVTVR
jgi:hypothetical protein